VPLAFEGSNSLRFVNAFKAKEQIAPLKPQRLDPAARQYAAWLGETERQVILPLKWVMLVLCSLLWMWSREWTLPEPPAFGLFIFFVGVTAAEHYFFARDRITPRQVRPFVFASFLLDALFVTALVILDSLESGSGLGRPIVSDFFALYVLLVLRGFALFRTRTENLVGFFVASVLFVLAATFQIREAELMNFMPAVQRLVLIWGLMIIIQMFINLVNAQKEEQIRSAERMVRSASLASLGELAAGVAHEIRNPISIIKTYADYLDQSTSGDDPNREDFQTIRNEAERCEEIVRRMLDFSNPQIQGFESVNVSAMVQETVAFVFHEGQEEKVEADLEIAEEIPKVQGDPVQLKQAFLNIMVNARQILIEHVDGQEETRRVAITLSRGTGPRPPVRLEVRDNGPGISEAEAERLFEPFFTRRRQGTGLGLAITRRIIEAHNGTIRLAPHTEGGTVVTIEIPIEGEEEA